MDWNNPILYPAFFTPHLMFEHHHLRSQTPPNEEIKREFTPMTISPGQSAETSPDMPSPTTDTYELLLSVRDFLSTLQLDSEGKVMDADDIFLDSMAVEEAKE